MFPLIPSSFGDIVAAATIVHSIYQALRDSTGSSFEYQYLMDDLRSFEDALHSVDRALRETPVNESDRQAIKAEITRCRQLLEKFWGSIKKYEVVISSNKRYTSIWRKITWAILKPNEVANFKQKLLQHKRNIDVFLHAVEIVMISGNRDETREGLSLVLHRLDVVQSQLPSCVGHDLGNALMLIDALGERRTLRMEFCFSQEELHRTLIHLFDKKIGQSHVERHDYMISTEDGKLIGGSNNWNKVVRKGAVIVMSVIVAPREDDAWRWRNTCPRCGETDAGVMPDGGWLQCRRCMKRFVVTTRRLGIPPSQEDNLADFRNLNVVRRESLQAML